jgi:glutamate/tyrosine decarboxylase-like PLP-dependent enzyme
VSDEVHVSVIKALGLLGFGRDRVVRLPVDTQGRIIATNPPPLPEASIVCVQAGNVNTGAVDPIARICDWAHEHATWVHVDGAFGMWAAASERLRPLVAGIGAADSWATDGHKWLNVPYDSGIAFVRDEAALRAAMGTSAAYLEKTDTREPDQYTPELSRRARGVDIWATLHTLGRQGIADLVERTCRHASTFAAGFEAAGFNVLNDVCLNQVLVSFGTPEQTRRVIALIQEDGTCWCGGTVWQGQTAMRISVSSWATTDEDVSRSLEAMIRIARAEPA